MRILAALIVAVLAGPAFGQANCALKNPDRQIYEIFPEATSYRSIDAKVDTIVRPKIEQCLGSPLAKTDIGKHTAYLVLKDDVPIGIVHARTEKGPRGPVELVWALGLDMVVRDFRVQRSRERHTKTIEADGFRNRLKGRDLATLRELTTRGNDGVNFAALGVPPAAADIVHTVVLCALKTWVITHVAFADILTDARHLGLVYESFPETASVGRIRNPVPVGADLGAIDAATVSILRSKAADGSTAGVVLRATWTGQADRPETWWGVAADGRIRRAIVVGEVTASVRRRFEALAGDDLAALGDAADGPERCGREVLGILAGHGVGSGS